MPAVHEFTAKTIDGAEKPLSDYKGKVTLLVNVASKCGLTPQYEGLEKIYQEYRDKGFTILGFPCNQFLRQEPASENEIKQFCSLNYGVTFDLFSKIDVNGKNAHPLYAFLTGEQSPFPGKISWNFEKFLIGKNGEVVKRFAPTVKPEEPEIKQAIESLL